MPDAIDFELPQEIALLRQSALPSTFSATGGVAWAMGFPSAIAMPEPISSANSSLFDRTQLMSDASCDPSTMTCGPTPQPRVVTIPPVLIEGEASRNELVAAYDKANRRAPECKNEAMAEAAGCGAVALSVVGTLAASPSGVGLVVGSGITALNVANCWRLIDDYTDCRDLGAARADAAARCEERGGVPLSGVDAHEIVCLMGAR